MEIPTEYLRDFCKWFPPLPAVLSMTSFVFFLLPVHDGNGGLVELVPLILLRLSEENVVHNK